jgi:hypothetical protein
MFTIAKITHQSSSIGHQCYQNSEIANLNFISVSIIQ